MDPLGHLPNAVQTAVDPHSLSLNRPNMTESVVESFVSQTDQDKEFNPKSHDWGFFTEEKETQNPRFYEWILSKKSPRKAAMHKVGTFLHRAKFESVHPVLCLTLKWDSSESFKSEIAARSQSQNVSTGEYKISLASQLAWFCSVFSPDYQKFALAQHKVAFLPWQIDVQTNRATLAFCFDEESKDFSSQVQLTAFLQETAERINEWLRLDTDPQFDELSGREILSIEKFQSLFDRTVPKPAVEGTERKPNCVKKGETVLLPLTVKAKAHLRIAHYVWCDEFLDPDG
uniref:Uncharacterized protein n=1 Tax=Chromera velia CCMP2878 TaxID=1169474 RepID=A0A0G4GA81_9ALVE|mmetsp:Transcript_5957/g.11836  ORF Transcript_5957/g.11836 Transcript_5957/m.11836 type:complete len:287 (+) Transcript_5957:255-1115(+)|eukprot:Cvel_20968.t1-p1 / transcript=Cvel_20968.t1 / gene=Cvel_20968 / organism=Chromera_velia_CCMP2878 / gene_product=hypothetical protein / transcript_product=hypothetical protein / location=Cvel_scaffold1928:7845-9619(-) / protein_length=286 / sequence_SO=supercontig / SO=protein_coding / is_pseudo=false